MTRNRFSSRNILVSIIAVSLFAIPLAVKVIPIHSGSMIAGFSSSSLQLAKVYGNADVFFLIKTYVLYLTSITLSLLFIMAVRKGLIEISNDAVIIISYVFGFWILFTAYFSMYPAEAFFGFRDRFEGAFVFCVYIMFMTVTRYSLESSRHVRCIFTAIALSSVFIAIISILQFIGFNVLEASYIAFLIKGHDSIDVITFGDRLYSAYGTLYNPNYLSGFMGMVLLLPATYYFFAKRQWIHWLMLVVTVVIWMGLLSSKSSSGFIAVGVSLTLLFSLVIWMDKTAWKKVGLLLLCFMIAFLIMDVVSEGVMTREYSSAFKYLSAVGSYFVSPAEEPDFESIGSDYVDDERWQELQRYYPYESSLDRLGSGRGFIWRNTTKLIIEKPIIGYGFDTIMYTFPQGDLRKYHGLGRMNVLVDKPHNLYLQIAYGAGLPALGLFLVMNLLVFWKTSRTLYKSLVLNSLDVSLLISGLMLTSYMVQGIFNDSVVGVSVLYWLLIGVLLYLVNANDEMLKMQEDKVEEEVEEVELEGEGSIEQINSDYESDADGR